MACFCSTGVEPSGSATTQFGQIIHSTPSSLSLERSSLLSNPEFHYLLHCIIYLPRTQARFLQEQLHKPQEQLHKPQVQLHKLQGQRMEQQRDLQGLQHKLQELLQDQLHKLQEQIGAQPGLLSARLELLQREGCCRELRAHMLPRLLEQLLLVRPQRCVRSLQELWQGLRSVTEMFVANFRLSRRFIADDDSSLGSLHSVNVGSVANVSEVHYFSIFKVGLGRLVLYM
jgi:hypothetical protein